ncbi:MAG: YtxH domain-containing protein [Bryobacterales bacterium]|nr:YtxH domain-containing protein [Bryobacterales bacterium]
MREDSGVSVIWFLAGMTIGAGAALLFAPQSGRVTRRMIRRRTQYGRDVIAERGRGAVEYGRSLYEKGKELVDEASGLVNKGRQMAQGEDS